MKQMAKQEGKGQDRAYVDLSTLYRSDPNRPKPARRRKSRVQKDGAADPDEAQAMREALEGWRWL